MHELEFCNKYPAGHGTQLSLVVLPMTVEYVPSGHCMQSVGNTVLLLYEPALQGGHDDLDTFIPGLR